MIVLVALGLPGWLISSAFNAFISPTGMAIGLLFVAIELVAGILLFRAGPLWPSAGKLYVASCLVWGSLMSLVLVFPASLAWMSITDKLGWDIVAASFSGGYPEEIAKAAGVLVILYAFRKLNRPWHGFVTGGLVGLGFEVNENLMYGSMGATMDPNSDAEGALMMWGMRLMAGPGLHIVLSALAGWGVGFALFRTKSLVALWWVGLAFVLHFLWNLMIPNETALMGHYAFMMLLIYPTFIWVYIRAVKMKKSDNSYVLLM